MNWPLVRRLPASVWALWGLQTVLTIRLLGHPATAIQNLPAYFADVFLAYLALAVYGWIVALAFARHPVLRAIATSLVVVTYAALVLFRWHSGGHMDWSVVWGFRGDLLDNQVRGMVSSLLGWRSYALLIAAAVGVVLLEVAGARQPAGTTPRGRGIRLVLLLGIAGFLAFGPLFPEDEFTPSLRALRASIELTRRMPVNAAGRPFPYVKLALAEKSGAPVTPAPNVFLVVVESFNANFVEARTMDGREYTPFFNSLIPKGLYVENFHGNSIETSRGHAALLFSIWPSMRGTMLQFYRGKHFRSLAEILREAGYETIFYQAARRIEFQDTLTFTRSNGFSVSRAAGEPDGMDRKDGRAWGWGVQDDVMFEEFFSYLDARERERKQAGPYFGFLATISSHYPNNKIPAGEMHLYPGGSSGRRAYANSINLADSYLRTFFRELEARGYLRNSLVIITGDHSYPAYEHDNGSSEIGFYEENFRTPFLVLWDGHIQPRRIRGELWSQIDVAPTVLDLLGIDVPNHFLGRSILKGFDPARDRVHLVQPYDGTFLAAIGGNLKYVFHLATGREFLFDLSRDPREDKNIIDEYGNSKELAQLRQEVGRIMLNQRLTEQDRIWPPGGVKP